MSFRQLIIDKVARAVESSSITEVYVADQSNELPYFSVIVPGMILVSCLWVNLLRLINEKKRHTGEANCDQKWNLNTKNRAISIFFLNQIDLRKAVFVIWTELKTDKGLIVVIAWNPLLTLMPILTRLKRELHQVWDKIGLHRTVPIPGPIHWD